MPQNTLRLASFLAGLLTFLSWELIAPHHAATASKARRWLLNLGLALLNGLIVTSLCAACYVIALRRLAPWRVGLFELTAAPPWLRLPAEIGALDLLTYWLHRGYHRVPLMWRFHRVHHTDLDLDVSSASRFHAGEVLASSVAKLAFVALLGISYQGLIAFEIVLLLAAQFQHANIVVHPRLEPMLWWTLVPPAMHRVHHSPEPEETDSNFGTLVVAWDRLFGTLRTHTASSPPFGLWYWRDERRLGLARIL
ncbi:MAG TPA: sterol desaturase family protein, partial [Thermoanaerobaculia bacterium]|nr:sterol desaturase family protein [Thermoanaerobaculia bacterium]